MMKRPTNRVPPSEEIAVEEILPAEDVAVAALYVDPRGHYVGVPGVELWDEKRDARNYAGPHPVVAHPPCSRWCRLAGLVEARWGHRVGEDGGLFAHALEAVRRWGGVLEHPAYTKAWPAHGLPDPDSATGWQATLCGGWVCHVEQGRYGHRAKKATWLYAYGLKDPPALRWGYDHDNVRGVVSFCRNRTSKRMIELNDQRPRLTKKEARCTPPEFRDALLHIARLSATIGRT